MCVFKRIHVVVWPVILLYSHSFEFLIAGSLILMMPDLAFRCWVMIFNVARGRRQIIIQTYFLEPYTVYTITKKYTMLESSWSKQLDIQ